MTGQVLDSPVASLVLPVLMRPILSNLERQDMAASQTLRAALSKVTWSHLGNQKRLMDVVCLG